MPNHDSTRTFFRLLSRRNCLILIILLGTVEAASWYWPIRKQTIQYDEAAYCLAAADIRENGVLSNYSYAKLRTYLYPTFLAMTGGSLRINSPVTRLNVFTIQTILFFFSLLLLYRITAITLCLNRSFARLALLSLNPIISIYLSYALTEILSLVLTLFAVFLGSVSLRGGKTFTWPHALLFGATLGCAVMTRPANIYLFGLALPVFALHLRRAAFSRRLIRTGGQSLSLGRHRPDLPSPAY